MTPEQQKKWLDAMRAAPGPIEVRINALLVDSGQMRSMIDPITKRAMLVFHSEAERDVWLDEMREQGLQG